MYIDLIIAKIEKNMKEICKGKSPGVPFYGFTSQYSLFKKFEFWRPFSKSAEKIQSCFALDIEQRYWPVTVQSLSRVKKIVMTSNVLLCP